MKSQLDMFKAEVIVFPCDRRWMEIRKRGVMTAGCVRSGIG
ncbi:hypothetical protein EV184_118112 [Sinorhizobium americanum]|uniref:Uncharacterized protein n=1 Tax=Sinorhizobium americanum TaxID=194963 RepID=A0A4R2BFU4_9HYPH|nr:hypothetical protein EV184_118112 [Sinorhizobium americanum]